MFLPVADTVEGWRLSASFSSISNNFRRSLLKANIENRLFSLFPVEFNEPIERNIKKRPQAIPDEPQVIREREIAIVLKYG